MTRTEATALACCEIAHALRFPALVLFAWAVGTVVGWCAS